MSTTNLEFRIYEKNNKGLQSKILGSEFKIGGWDVMNRVNLSYQAKSSHFWNLAGL